MSALITPSEFTNAMGRIYKRANVLQAHIYELADIALSQGHCRQSVSLREIGARAQLVADKYVEVLASTVR